MNDKDFLILVDNNDMAWGKLEKDLVHEKGLLHRAFSVFIFNSNGEMLLQQRADNKYHSGGLWTNACCSHPRFGEELNDAVARRLQEEMGLTCATDFAFSFIYKAGFANGLTEHEYDHVYTGTSDQVPTPDASEIKDWKYENIDTIEKYLETNPDQFTVWFRLCFQKVVHHIHTNEKLLPA
jgi:isopentenyl-diphosphate delta-isomerase